MGPRIDLEQESGVSASPDPASVPPGEETVAAQTTDHNAARLILRVVKTHGYAHVSSSMTLERFESITLRIGGIALRTDVTIDRQRRADQLRARTANPGRPGVYSADGLPFHTDNPAIDIIAWYCVEQDSGDGASLLVDAGDLRRHFSAGEAAVLESVCVSCASYDTGPERVFREPLLSTRGSEIYYAPWLLYDAYDSVQQQMIARFQEYISRKAATETIAVRLGRGQSLFIDNRRMLHGRGSIAGESERHLVRLWIQRESRGRSAHRSQD